MSGHTPGPWAIGNRYGEDALMAASGVTVAYAAWDGGSGCHLAFGNDTDARLIAAAPDLLEFAQMILDESEFQYQRDAARDVIRKATEVQS